MQIRVSSTDLKFQQGHKKALVMGLKVVVQNKIAKLEN